MSRVDQRSVADQYEYYCLATVLYLLVVLDSGMETSKKLPN